MEAKWVPVMGYEDKYEISDLGEIRSLTRNESFMGSSRIRKGRLMAQDFLGEGGYGRIRLCKDGVATRYSVHRLVAFHFVENPNNYPQVNHKDGVKTNNSASNLEWCTVSQNVLHKFHVLKKCLGEENANSTTTKEQVEKIREMARSGASSRAIAEKLKLHLSCVEHIRYRRTWKHVQ